MNRISFFALVAALALGLGVSVHSQAPAQPKSVLQQLQAMKAQNQAVLDKQTALLLKLEELQKEAAQVKFLAKRG
jgi:uncharacterized protein HemX